MFNEENLIMGSLKKQEKDCKTCIWKNAHIKDANGITDLINENNHLRNVLDYLLEQTNNTEYSREVFDEIYSITSDSDVQKESD